MVTRWFRSSWGRPARGLLSAALGAVTALGAGAACNWTTFDDLQDGVGVDRVVKPNNSRQYGEAIIASPLPSSPAGAKVTVLGRSSATLSTLVYDQNGDRAIATISDFRQSLGLALFPENPPLVAEPVDPTDPDFDNGANRFLFPVITGDVEQGEGRVVAMSAEPLGGHISKITFKDPATRNERVLGIAVGHLENVPVPTFPNSMPADLVNAPDKLDLVVGRGPQINMVVDYTSYNYDEDDTVPLRIWGCNHGEELAYRVVLADVIDDGDPLTLGDNGPEIVVGVGSPDDQTPRSELRIYSPTLLRGGGGDSTEAAPLPCGTPMVPPHTIDTAADLGATVVATKFDPDAVLSDIVYATVSGNTVFVRIGDTGERTELEISSVGSEFGRAIAVGNLDDDPQPELVIGAPRGDAGGETDAGLIYIYNYEIDGAGVGTFAEPIVYMTSSPTASERYGKSLAIVPWDADRNVLVVGAEGKIFTYFRTSFYDDVRLGR